MRAGPIALTGHYLAWKGIQNEQAPADERRAAAGQLLDELSVIRENESKSFFKDLPFVEAKK